MMCQVIHGENNGKNYLFFYQSDSHASNEAFGNFFITFLGIFKIKNSNLSAGLKKKL